MIRYEFREEESSLGKVLRPVSDVILEWDGVRVELPMYIDSGADISMIPFRFGKALGFRQIEYKNCLGINRGSFNVIGKNEYI